MTTTEKIALALDNEHFTLFKEGMFYKCYNEDAKVFVQRVKEYKVSSKFVKSVGGEVYSLGFPISEVVKETLNLSLISKKLGALNYEDKGSRIVFLLLDDKLKSGYQEWIESINSKKKKGLAEPPAVYLRNVEYRNIISEIKTFDLANTTPMQSLGFVQLLKEKVQQLKVES